jgi:predicted aminopeptidase
LCWLLLPLLLATGCKTLSFYAQAIKGQCQIVAREEPIPSLMADPRTPAELRARFQLLDQFRAFAETRLRLPVNGHYRKYADLGRPFVVWNVEAAREFSMEPKAWWYPLVGRLEYRGFFLERGATNYAAWLRNQGYDVSVGGVEAYSTLGWFKDPVLNTFLFQPAPELAETFFHELAHQRVFAPGDTDFNEAFATTVGQEGARRWLQASGDGAALGQYLAHLRRTSQFARLVMKTRLRLETLYGDERGETGQVKAGRAPRNTPAGQLRRQKEQILSELRQEYEGVKAQWGGDPEYDSWFAGQLNNAQLNSVAAYYDLVPAFERLLALKGGDLASFYSEVQRLARMPRKVRHQWLRGIPERASDD